MANYAEKIADRLIWPSLFLAALVWLTTGDPSRAAAILTLDFVTGIRVSIPTAFLGALNHTTRHGILVRSGRTLEQLAEAFPDDKARILRDLHCSGWTVAFVGDGLNSLRPLVEHQMTLPSSSDFIK